MNNHILAMVQNFNGPVINISVDKNQNRVDKIVAGAC